MGSPAINGGYLGQPADGRVQLRLYNRDERDMSIYLEKVNSVGRYELNFDTNIRPNILNPKNYAYYTIRKPSPTPDEFYITTSQVTGWVNLTVADITNRRLAGTFEFEAIDNQTGKIVRITKGRFDIDQNTLNK